MELTFSPQQITFFLIARGNERAILNYFRWSAGKSRCIHIAKGNFSILIELFDLSLCDLRSARPIYFAITI